MRRLARRAILTAVAALASLSIPTALVAQAAKVSFGKAANQLSVSIYSDSAVVALTGPDPEGEGTATARLNAALPDANKWATTARAAVTSCRADKTRAQHVATLYDRLARDDRGEGRTPRATFACGRDRRGELASMDVAMTGDFSTGLLFSSYSEAQIYFQKVVKSLAQSASPHSKR
jgi:hypothetical protein